MFLAEGRWNRHNSIPPYNLYGDIHSICFPVKQDNQSWFPELLSIQQCLDLFF